MPVGMNETPVGFVDPACPIAWDHPLNRGLNRCWSVLPNPGWSGGLSLREITGKGSSATLTGFDSPFSASSGWVPGKNPGRKALRFNGGNDYVGLGVIPSAPFTVTAWLMASGVNLLVGNEFQNNSGFVFGPLGGPILFQISYAGGLHNIIAGAIQSKFQMYSLTVDSAGTGVTGYLDGISIGSGTMAGTYAPGAAQLSLGEGLVGGGSYVGVVEDVRYYNRKLASGEIQQLYQEQLRGSPETLRWVGARTYGISSQDAPAAGNLFRNANLSGLQGGGPFFVNPLGA